MKRSTIYQPRFWIITVFFVGLLYLISLNLLVSDGVYFTGDSGLRAMFSQNLAAHPLVFDLNLPDPPWVKALWVKGLFPYEEPFVYHIDGKYFITFPYTFPFITAPFYAAFGYRGLYVIPFLSTVIIWLVFLWLCRKLNFNPIATGLGLFFLIFPTDLTLFGALYWEHTLSVCLAFAGLSLFIPGKDSENVDVWSIISAGVLTGLAVWFRPEQIFLVFYLSLISLYSFGKAIFDWPSGHLFDLGKVSDFIGKKGWVYLASSSVTLLLYGITNWMIYRNFFGVHSIQVLDRLNLRERLATFIEHLQAITIGNVSFFLFTPISLFLVGFLVITLIRKTQVKYEHDWTIWYGFLPVLILGVSVLVPPGAGGKQWGPRFLLLLVPVVTLLFTWHFDRLLKNSKFLSRIGWYVVLASIVLLGVAGIIQNPLRGRDFIIYNYNQVKPAVDALRAEPEPVIAVSSSYLSQVFQSALDRKVSFLAVRSQDEMGLFRQALLDQNLNTFIYICYSFDCKLFPPEATDIQFESNGKIYSLETLTVNDYGKYTIRKIYIH